MGYHDLGGLSDAELVACAREALGRGDPGVHTAKTCVALMFERRRALVRAICAAKAPPDVVDDLESQVYERFVRVVYTHTTPMRNPSGLLVKMARNVVASHFEKRGDDAVPYDEIPDAGALDDGYDEAETSEYVEQLLSTLNPAQRQVVWARVMEGRSSADIGARLAKTAGNVDVIFFRALDKLRKVVER
jgi:RNA polymerase sigma factor (sigma-70 family)